MAVFNEIPNQQYTNYYAEKTFTFEVVLFKFLKYKF